MAYVAGLYTGASQAAADEAKRFREFQTQIDDMGARERAGLYRRDQAAMDQFTAGLKPQSAIATPDWTMPAAPASGGAAGSNYERDRFMQERKLLESQFNSEIGAQKTLIDDLGRQKYILEQQLSVAPAYQQQAIRDRLTMLNNGINNAITSTRARVETFNTLFKDIDKSIRTGDYNRDIMSGTLPAAPGGYTPGAMPDGGTAQPEGLGARPQPIPVPESLGMVPEAPAPQPGVTTTAATATPPPAQVAPDSQAFIAALTPAQFNALPKDQQDAVLAAVNRERMANRDRANFATIPAAASDIAARPLNALAYMFNWASEAGDLPRYARAIGLGDITSIQLPYMGADPTATSTPYSDMVYRLREASTPLTREQFLENLKANEQQASVQEGKGDVQAPPAAPGMAPPTTPEAAAAAVPALQQAGDVPIGDPANPRVAAITEYSAQTVAARAQDLPTRLGAAVTSEQGQTIITRAKALGVDPAAAMAIYGIESTFGAKSGQSGAGAVGPLQVGAGEWSRFQQWFLNPDNQRRYKITPAMVEAASTAVASSIDAGLLRLKYNELIGVDKNLWGAAYQANAEEVRDAGAPLPVHDAGKTGTQGLTNSDYNKLYVSLYNEARQYVNIPPTTATSQADVVGNSQTIRALDAQQEQINSDYEFILTTLDTERKANIAKRQEIERRVRIAQEYGDRAAYDTAVTDLETLANIDRDINIKLRTAETEARLGFDKLNLARTDEYIKMAVAELDANNPKPFADMVSRGTGMLVEIAPIEGGKFAVYQNNRLVSGKGYTLKQVKDQYLSPISQAYDAQRATLVEEERKFQSDVLKDDLKLARDITLEQIKAGGEMQKQGWTEGKEVRDAEDRVSEKWFTKGTRVIRMRLAPDREENGLVVKGGVIVEEVSTAGLK